MQDHLFESFPYGIIRLNAQGTVDRLNKRAKEFLQMLTPEQTQSLIVLTSQEGSMTWSISKDEVWNIDTFEVAGDYNLLILIGEEPFFTSKLPPEIERSLEDLSADPCTVVSKIAGLIGQVLTFERFDLVRVDRNLRKYSYEYSIGIDIEGTLHTAYSTISNSGLGWIFKHEAPHLVSKMTPEDFSFREDPLLYQTGFRSLLRVPILFDHGVVGAILMADSKEEHFQIEDAFLIHQLSKHIAQAFFHAGIQLNQVYQSLAFATFLQSVTSQITPEQIPDFLKDYCEKLRVTAQVEHVSLFLFDEQLKKRECLVEVGKALVKAKGWSPIGESGMADALHSKSIISYNLADPRYKNVDPFIGQGFTSVLFAPVEGEERIIAMFVAIAVDEKALSPFLAGLFKVASEQISPIITKLLPQCPNRVKKSPAAKKTAPEGFNRIIGSSPVIHETIQRAARAAQYDFPILLTGETGTGKELFAKAIHQASRVSQGPFIVVNSAAIPANLLESELFGYQEGAFTGGVKGGKRGKILLADGGTLFLDEIGELSPELQAKLLRVIQEQEVEPLGAAKPIPVHVRIISATHRDLKHMVEQGEFREDLYYRLNAIEIKLPPLRERGEDVIELAEHMLQFLSRLHGVPTKSLSPATKELFLNYSWPGNVRQLQNVINRLFVFVESSTIQPQDLPPDLRTTGVTKNESEKEEMERLLSEFGGNKTALAHYLGITRTGLWKKLKRLGIQ